MNSKLSRLSIAALAAFCWTTTAFAQDNQGTPRQSAACARDAFRLCSSYIPDATRVEGCLRQRKPDLSDACRFIFEESIDQQRPASQRTDWDDQGR